MSTLLRTATMLLLFLALPGIGGASVPPGSISILSTTTDCTHHDRRRPSVVCTAAAAGFCHPGINRCNNNKYGRRKDRGGKIAINQDHNHHARHALFRNNGKNSLQYKARRRRESLSALFSEVSEQQLPISDSDDKENTNDDSNHWTSQTLAIALPALAGMMTDPILSMVDTLFVGQLGNNNFNNGGRSSASSGAAAAASSIPLAALGACTSIFHLSFHCFRATTLSTSSLVAGALVRDEQQQKEQNNSQQSTDGLGSNKSTTSSTHSQQKEAVLIAQTSIQQSLITGTLITTFLLTFGPKCLAAMGIPFQGELYASASTYLNHRALAAPAVVMLAASEGIFRGYGDVVTPWKVSVVVALMNLMLDPFCMFGGGSGRGLGMGIKGAAVATAFSQVCGAFLYGRWLSQKGLVGEASRGNGLKRRVSSVWNKLQRQKNNTSASLKQQKRQIAMTILKANAAMLAKQGSLLLGWAYATSRATRMGNAVVASHQLALSIWLVVALVLEGAGVAAQVLMAKEWEGLRLMLKRDNGGEEEAGLSKGSTAKQEQSLLHKQRRTIRSLSLYMLNLSLFQGLLGALSILLIRKTAPPIILTQDLAVRANLLELLPHIAKQMQLVSATLVAEALAIGGGRFKWLAAGTTVSSVLAVVKLHGAKDLVGIWNGGIVALFVGRLATALLAVMDMNGAFPWRERNNRKDEVKGD